MLTPSHFPHSVGLSYTLKYTHSVVLFEQLCSALCVFISAIVMVLLLSFLPLHPALLSNVTMGNYRRIQLANLNGRLLVEALKTVVGEGQVTFSCSSLEEMV